MKNGMITQRALVTARPRVLAAFVALIPASPAKPVRFRIQHRIQSLFDSAAHHLAKMILDPGLINPDNVAHLLSIVIINHSMLPSITIKGTVSIRKCAKDFVRYRWKSDTSRTS